MSDTSAPTTDAPQLSDDARATLAAVRAAEQSTTDGDQVKFFAISQALKQLTGTDQRLCIEQIEAALRELLDSGLLCSPQTKPWVGGRPFELTDNGLAVLAAELSESTVSVSG